MIRNFLAAFCIILFTSCSHNKDEDPMRTQFASWVAANKYNFNTYFVIAIDGCNSCTSEIIKLIRDGMLEIDTAHAIVLITKSKADLYPVKEYLRKSNLLVYNLPTQKTPIIDYLPRIYTKGADGKFEYTSLTIPDFKKWIDNAHVKLKMGHYWDGSIKHTLKGIVIPGNEGFMVLNSKGKSHQFISIFDAQSN